MNNSAPCNANLTTSNFLQEHRLTHELVLVGLQLIDKNVSISESAIEERMTDTEGSSFPIAKIGSYQ